MTTDRHGKEVTFAVARVYNDWSAARSFLGALKSILDYRVETRDELSRKVNNARQMAKSLALITKKLEKNTNLLDKLLRRPKRPSPEAARTVVRLMRGRAADLQRFAKQVTRQLK